MARVATSRTYRSEEPERRELNTIVWPSGDHRELDVLAPPTDVICVAAEPSAFATQISSVPERVDVNVSRFPSAEKSGLYSSNVDAISSVGPPCAAEPRSGKRQMFV